jgi:hypothetical protein
MYQSPSGVTAAVSLTVLATRRAYSGPVLATAVHPLESRRQSASDSTEREVETEETEQQLADAYSPCPPVMWHQKERVGACPVARLEGLEPPAGA